jgi:hypothetical protein
MDTAPPQTRKAIGDEPGIAGTVKATVDLGGLDQWPTDVADCARTAGVTLPPLKPVGAPIVWTMTQADDLAVQSPGLATSLDDNASGPFGYTTTQESVDTSHGDPASSDLRFKASIRRNAVASAQQAISDLVFQQIPDLVRPILYSILQQRIHGLLDTIAGLLDNYGYANVTVSFHQPSPTTTTAPALTTASSAAAAAPIDPCSLVTTQDATAAMGSDHGDGLSTPEPWGGQCNIDDGTILLNVLTGPAYKGGKTSYDAYLAGAQQAKANDTTGKSVFDIVGGIGSGAFVSGGGPIAACAFYIGDTTVAITVSNGGAAGPPPHTSADEDPYRVHQHAEHQSTARDS